MTASRLTDRAWSASLVASLRRWWFVPATLAVLAGALGYLAVGRMPATATAQVSVQLVSSGGDSTLVEQVVASAMERLDQRAVFSRAAAARGQDASDLRARTTIAEAGTSTVLDINVSDPSATKAADDANAVAEAAISEAQEDLGAGLKDITARTDALLKQGKLAGQAAEAARVISVAQQLGAAQSNMVTQFGTLTLIQPADAKDVARTSAASAGLLSAVGGGLAGFGIALALGARRGRARNAGEVAKAAPNARVVTAARRAAVLRVEAAYLKVLVLAPMGTDTESAERVASVRRDLEQAGYKLRDAALSTLRETPPIQTPHEIIVVTEPASPELLAFATSHPDAVCLVLASLKHDRLEDIAALDAAAERPYHIAVEA